jgi:CSLREA domain-containing protein
MRVIKSRNLRSTAVYIVPFIAAICLCCLSVSSVQAATFTVMNTNDSGPGSLRQAIADAASGDTIDFNLSACPCTITLTSGELVIGKSLTIRGLGANQLIVSGNNASRVFSISSSHTVLLDALTMTGGNGVGAKFSGDGGAIYNEGILTVTNSAVSGNSAGLGFDGGGIRNDGGPLTLINSTVSGNSAGFNGGGIRNSGVLRMFNSTVSSNSAGLDGGGIHSFGQLTVTNSTVSGNSAKGNGGGITAHVTLTLTNSTVTGNLADSDGDRRGVGGGIAGSGFPTLTLNNTIVAGNFRSTGTTSNDIDGTVNFATNNLVGDAATSGGITDGVNGNIVGINGAGTRDINTILNTTLANNGGPTKTHALVLGSPALNAGSNALLPTDTQDLDGDGDTAETLPVDQRGPGFARVDNTTVDIGAFEGTALVVTKTADTNDGTCDADCSLREAITAANAAAGAETIVFDIPTTDPGYDAVADRYTIALTDVLPVIDSDMSINGLGAKRLTVNRGAGGHFRIFNINNGTTVSILGLTISGGWAKEGGGIRNTGTLSITGSIIRDNLTENGPQGFCSTANLDGGDGGGIYNGGYLMVDSSTFIGNRTGNGGPGNDQGQCTWSPGNGGNGGAISNLSGTVIIRNSTFSGNQTGNGGDPTQSSKGGDAGAVYNTGSLSISNTTINANIVGNGGRGSVANASNAPGSFGLSSSIIANTTVGSNLVDDVYGIVSSGDYNLVTSPGGILPGAHNITGLDPMLGPLADNGGPTMTHALLCGSPAIDAGVADALATDQRGTGFIRKFDDPAIANAADGDGTDIGAFEVQAPLVCNTAPVANGDSYSTNEDGGYLGVAPGVLGNDTDADANPLTASLVSGPAHAKFFSLAPDGAFLYVPVDNFNGTDSFTYKANDGSLDSNVATVTITVNAVNDAPVASATPAAQTAQYSDPISQVTATVTDIDSLSVSYTTSFSTNGVNFTVGLPNGLSASPTYVPLGADGTNCTLVLSGNALVPAGVYTIRFTFNDGFLSSSVDHILTVTKEKTETVYTGDVFMFTAGPTVTTANVRLSAQLTQQADGNAGDITKAKVSFLLFKSTNLGATPDLTVGGVPVDASGGALKSVNLGVDTWTIKVKIDADNGYWKASPVGMGTVTVEQPTTELRTSGGGWVSDAQSMNGKGNFGFNVANQKKGVRGGSVYLFRGLDGFTYLVKNTSWQSGGIGFSSEGAILSKAAFSGKCVVQKIDSDTGEIVDSFGNYSFTIDVRDGDLFNPRQADKYAITVLNSNGLVWRQIGSRTNPLAIGGGNITVKAK